MMKTKANCRACNKKVAASGSKKHITQCAKVQTFLESKENLTPGFLLKVVDYFAPDVYWMYITAPKNMNLDQLDVFLRKLWLECCGHLSQFDLTADKTRGYSSLEPDDFMHNFEGGSVLDVGSKKKHRLIGDVTQVGDTFSYTYDMGSSTMLKFQTISEIDCPADRFIIVMRNENPAATCGLCEQPAEVMCSYCDHALCEECKTSNHSCKNAFLLPLVNSPRAGVCGYDGPSVEEGQD